MEIRERIITAFSELSQARGFYNVTMDELASSAGVSKRTIYRHFRSKEDIIEAVLDRFMANADREVAHIIATEETIEKVIYNMLKYISRSGRLFFHPLGLKDLRQYYPYLWKKIEDFRTEKIQSVFREKEGSLREVDPRIITAAILASIRAVINPDFILDNELTFEEASQQLIELLMYGFVKK